MLEEIKVAIFYDDSTGYQWLQIWEEGKNTVVKRAEKIVIEVG